MEGPRQGEPVSRVRVISLRRHARSLNDVPRASLAMMRAERESDADDAPARSLSIVNFFYRSFRTTPHRRFLLILS